MHRDLSYFLMPLQMNISQQIFTVFFAIVWGTMANVQPRWKPFHWSLAFYFRPAANRLVLSILVFNILSIAFFVWTLSVLGNPFTASIPVQILRGILPSFAPFGFYRVWIAAIEWKTSWFYRLTSETRPDIAVKIEPTATELGIEKRWWRSNLIFGLFYLAVASLVPLCS